MPKRISISLLFTVVIAIVALFAATQAVAGGLGDGECEPSEAAKFQCFENGGYVVEISPSNGQFPYIDASGNSVFEYKITEKGSRLITDINLLISACTPELVIRSYSTPKWFLFKEGSGDMMTKVGRGLTLDDTGRFGDYNATTGTISLTLDGIVAAVHKPMTLINSSDFRKWAIGEILAPGCLLEPQIVTATTRQTVREGEKWCTVEITEGPEGNSVVRIDGTCTAGDVNIVPRGKYGDKDIIDIELGIWYRRASSPACWCYCLPNGEDCEICF